MKNKKAVILCGLILLLFINFSYALDDSNIALTTDENVKITCPCSLVKYQLELSNTGDFSENYFLDVSKTFKRWSELTVEKITLAPESSVVLDFYLKPGCEVYGNYSAFFKVTAEKTRLAAKMPLYLFIAPCYNYNIIPGDYSPTDEEDVFLFRKHYGDYELCEKEDVTIPILIENTAPVSNEYELELLATKWAELDKTEVEINAENSTIVDLNVKVPENLEENYTFLIETETKWGDLEQDKEFNVSVNWCYTPLIKTDKVKVNYTRSINQLEIQNLGIKKADYSFEIIEKPGWVEVRPLNITVMPNETRMINIVSEPGEEVKQGYYNLVINTTSQNSVGYESAVVIKLKKKGIIRKAYDYLKQKTASAYGWVKGLIKDYVWYLLGGIAGLIILWIIFSSIRKAVIKRRELKEIEEEAEPEIKKKKEKPEKKIKKRKFKIRKWVYVFIIIVLLALAVFALIKTKDRIYGYGKAAFDFLKPYSYYIGFGILALILLLIIIIRFARKKDIEEEIVEEDVEEEPEEKEEVEEIEEAEKKVKKKRDFSKILKILLWALVVALLIFTGSYFRNYILFFIKYIAGGVIALLLLIFIIKTSKNKKAKKHFKKKWKSYLLVLILVLILAGAYFTYQNKYYVGPYNKAKAWLVDVNSKLKNMTYVPEQEEVEEEVIVEEEEEVVEEEIEEEVIEEEIIEEEVIEEEAEEEIIEEEIEGASISWDQNSEYILDLNKYFKDPDGDKLYFSSSYVENIGVDIDEQGIAVLNPKEDWYGHEKVIFIADDKKGGIIESDEITLVVKKSREETSLEKIKNIDVVTKAKDLLKVYSGYIITGLAVLIIALLFLRYSEKKANKKNKRKKRKTNKRKK